MPPEMTPERAIKLLRNKIEVLEGALSPSEDLDDLFDAVTLIAEILAQHIERVEVDP